MRVARLVLLFALAAAAHASSLRGVVVHLRAHGDRTVLLLDRDDALGVPRAVAFFRKHFPRTYESLNTWTVLALLREPAVRARIAAIMQVSNLERVSIVLQLTDEPETLYRGETAYVPLPGGALRARFGAVADRDLAALARRLGARVSDVAAGDPERFAVFPHTLRHDGPRGTSVYCGESGIGAACAGEVATAREMLVHEIAHVADTADHPADRATALREHEPYTLLPPAIALAEGWADYWAMQLPGPMQQYLRDLPPRNLLALGPGVTLRCSPVVGAVLTDLAALPPGPPALYAAMRAAWARPSPTLADVLAAYVRANGLTMRVAEALARRTGGQATPVDYLLRARGAGF